MCEVLNNHDNEHTFTPFLRKIDYMCDCLVRDLTTKKHESFFLGFVTTTKTPKTLDSIFLMKFYSKACMNQRKLYKLKILLKEMYLTKTKMNGVITSKIPD